MTGLITLDDLWARVRTLPPIYLTIAEMKALADYSSTNPTGAYVGKMWRRQTAVRNRDGYAVKPGPWLVCQYGKSITAGQVTVNSYKPILSTCTLADVRNDHVRAEQYGAALRTNPMYFWDLMQEGKWPPARAIS